MYTKAVVQTFIWFLVIALLLFIPAGTIKWWAAWIFILENILAGLVLCYWLAQHDPALLKERLSFVIQAEQQTWDKVLMAVLVLLIFCWLPFMAHEVRYHNSSPMPLSLQVLGAIGIAISMWFNFLIFRENSFAAPVVKVQKERKHKVISTGLYSYVRHPMYTGALFYFFGTPLLLGSWWGLIFAVLLSFLIAIRAYKEEQMLLQELEGYEEYMKKVRYRLIPYVW